MVIIGVIMVLYSFMGGQMTVMVTDFVNVAILAVAVITLFILTLGQDREPGRVHPTRFPPGS